MTARPLATTQGGYMTRAFTFIAAVFVLVATTSSAQTIRPALSAVGDEQPVLASMGRGFPGVETSVGLSVFRDANLEELSSMGFFVSVANNVNPWAGLVLEGSGHYFRDIANIPSFNGDIYTLGLGPRFTARTGTLAPFAQFLVGAAYFRASAMNADATDWDFLLQPGGGLDVVLSDRFAVRVGLDFPTVFDSGVTDTHVRFSVGATFRGASRR